MNARPSMYTVTFYSFKGGVGRTMALVNVAAQLAAEGKRVLMVDFDLEAPGLMSFDWDCANKETMGLVEYVTNYRETMEAPSVADYLCRSKIFPSGGELWIMPAGKHDAEYSARLNNIDWRHLYEHEEGYLLFEDLKLQWQRQVQPDYVFIDSRTGHSDVEGICTRQLPDAVSFLFFPNEQNLQGLGRVCKSILVQNEKRKNTRNAIKLHFVASNVPDLDDEEEIIGRRLEQFKGELGYKSLAATIHHYNSLSLLDQDVFSINRPKSRLALEYAKLRDSIVRENLLERSAALLFLKQTQKALTGNGSAEPLTDAIARAEQVLQNFPSDDEITYRVALIFESIGRLEDAVALLSDEQRINDAVGLAVRARLHHRLQRKEEAIEDLREMLNARGAELSSFLEAMSYIGQLVPELYDHVPSSVAFASLDRRDKVFAALGFDTGIEQLRVQVRLLNSLLEDEAPDNEFIKHQLALALVGTADFKTAVSLLSVLVDGEASISDYFNMGMALWGLHGVPTAKWFEKVAEIDMSSAKKELSPNYMQCLGITYALLGDTAAALRYTTQAKQLMVARPRQQFSAWTYSRVSSGRFIDHLRTLEVAITEKADLRPAFLDQSLNGLDRRLH